MVDENRFFPYQGNFQNGKLEGWAKCYAASLQNYDPYGYFMDGIYDYPPHAIPRLEVEFKDGKMTGKGRINLFAEMGQGILAGGKHHLVRHYEGQINALGQPDGVGQWYHDTADYPRPLKSTLYIDSLVSSRGTNKSARRVFNYDPSWRAGEPGKLKSVVFDAVYAVTDGASILEHGAFSTHVASGREVRYFPNGKVAQEFTFTDNGQSHVVGHLTYHTTTIYLPNGRVAYSGKADLTSLLSAKGTCLSGNCQTGEGTYQWVRNVEENYAGSTGVVPAVLVTKGRFLNGKPMGQHRVTISTGAEFVGVLTPQYTFNQGTIRQDNFTYQGSFNLENELSGGMSMATGYPHNHPFHTVAGLSVALVESGGNAVVLPEVETTLSRQFTNDMHLGTVDATYTQLESPVSLTLTDSVLSIDNIRLRYRIDWGANGELQTEVNAMPVYDPVRKTIQFEYTILSENEGSKRWRLKVAQFETAELTKLGIKTGARTGQLTARQGTRILWSSDVTTYTETRQQWRGYDYRAGAVYEEVKTEHDDRFIRTYKLPMNYFCNGQPIGSVQLLIFSENPNFLSPTSVMMWAGTKLLLGAGGLRENTVFVGQYGYVNFETAVDDISRKVQRQGCVYKPKR